MPPHSPPPKTTKPYFFYGHRKPSQNRPTVRGGIFSNRKTLHPNPHTKFNQLSNFDLQKWDPESAKTLLMPPTKNPAERFFSIAQTLSPIARYIVDSFKKHKNWGPGVVEDLSKLRRVTPKLVAEVLKVQNDPRVSSKFFYWAGKQKGYRHDFACYNAFAYCLNRGNQFRAADQVPDLMQMQGKPPGEKQFEILIRMHSDANRGLRVYHVYEKMKKFGVKPRVFLYNRVMDALVRTGHLDLALLVYDDFRADGLVEETVTYMILVKGLCEAGNIDEMLGLLDQMRGTLCKPDIFAYTAMIRVLVEEGRLDGCSKVWEEMKRDNVEPDNMAYATMVTGFCKGKRVEEGYALFKEMKEKGCLIDRAIYGSLIQAFVADGKVGQACDLLKDLINSGYRADLLIYNSLIEGLCNLNQVDKACKLFQVTVEESLNPDFVTVNPILVSFAELKRMDDFCNLLLKMQNLGFSIVDELSRFFSFMLRKVDEIWMALEVFEHLKVKGFSSVSIYNILMEVLNEIGEVNKALSLFNELKDSRFKPDATTHSIAITCFAQVGDLQEACNCYNKIKETSSVPSVASYFSLVKGLCKIGEIDAAMMLIHDCLANVTCGPLEFKYTLTVLHACKTDDADKVIAIVNEIMQLGFQPDDIIFSAIISGMCKHGTIEEARKVFLNMRKQNILTEANLIVYDEKLIDHMKKKTADLVLSGLKFFGLESKLKAKGSKILTP
ncbi:hypothetical protein NMG60_11031783 [Bertholletia excelsa]